MVFQNADVDVTDGPLFETRSEICSARRQDNLRLGGLPRRTLELWVKRKILYKRRIGVSALKVGRCCYYYNSNSKNEKIGFILIFIVSVGLSVSSISASWTNASFGELMRMTCRTSAFVMHAHFFHEEMLVKCNIYLSLRRIMNVKTRNTVAFIKIRYFYRLKFLHSTSVEYHNFV